MGEFIITLAIQKTLLKRNRPSEENDSCMHLLLLAKLKLYVSPNFALQTITRGKHQLGEIASMKQKS